MKSTPVFDPAVARFPGRRWLLTAYLISSMLPVIAQADVERGKGLYENHCLVCHSDAIHKRKRSKVDSREALNAWIQAWSTHAGLNWSDQEVNDTAGYMILKYYRFIDAPSKN